MNLTLRKTVIKGETSPDDYCVTHDGRSVGRIHKTDGVNGSILWNWHVSAPPLPIPPWCNGSAESLEGAKSQFESTWERFYAGLSPERIRRWHLIDDMMGKSNEWWLD
jgi:hypothetical protein